MATLIITVLLGLIIAFFAIQNTAVISLNFFNYKLPGIPTYIVVVGALLVGLFLSWIISFVNGIITGFTIRDKDSQIKNYKNENAQYLKQIHQLELENARLMAETNAPADDKSL